MVYDTMYMFLLFICILFILWIRLNLYSISYYFCYICIGIKQIIDNRLSLEYFFVCMNLYLYYLSQAMKTMTNNIDFFFSHYYAMLNTSIDLIQLIILFYFSPFAKYKYLASFLCRKSIWTPPLLPHQVWLMGGTFKGKWTIFWKRVSECEFVSFLLTIYCYKILFQSNSSKYDFIHRLCANVFTKILVQSYL